MEYNFSSKPSLSGGHDLFTKHDDFHGNQRVDYQRMLSGKPLFLRDFPASHVNLLEDICIHIIIYLYRYACHITIYLSNYLSITYILVMSQCYIPNQPGLTFLIQAALRRRPAWLARDSQFFSPMAPWLNTAFYTFLKSKICTWRL